jgi:hypothetical protein
MRNLASGVYALALLLASGAAWAQPDPVVPEPIDAEPPNGDEEGGGDVEAPAPDEDDTGLPPGHPPVQPGDTLPPRHPPVQERADDLPPVPLAPPALFPSQLVEAEQVEVVGFQNGILFLRDPHDVFRLYPGAHLSTDFSWAPGSELSRELGGRFLEPSFMVRRANLELRGEIIERIAFTAGIELGGGRIGETVYAGEATPRLAPANAHDGVVRPSEANVSYRFREWLNFTAGLQNLPFSMSNRTRHFMVPFLERNLAIRGFAVPHEQDLGLTVWGDVLEGRALSYEIGVFGGDGPHRPFADARPDFAGRVWARPLASLGEGEFFAHTQVGISARHGQRDPAYVAYDYPTIASNRGFVFWQPGYVDSLDRLTHVIPSGAQNAIGGELRVPFRVPGGSVFEVRGEAYYVANQTREAVEGFLETNTERFGSVTGVGWYGQITYWACCTDQLVTGEPGVYRPWTVEPGRDIPVKRGLEISALAAGIAANYDGATREGSLRDANTPSANIALYQLGGIVQYWYNYNFRAAVEYFAYYAPDSGDPARNQAVVPDNLVITDGARGGGNAHHELAARLAVTF